MRDFIVGLCAIAIVVSVCMVVGSVLCGTVISLDSTDDNLFVKTGIGFFAMIGTFVFIMLSESVGALINGKDSS